jgi:hypothetical protein
MTAKKLGLISIPAAALVCVALSQIFLVHSASLTPWRGGGFGMFSTTDRGTNRVLAVIGKDKTGNLFRISITPRNVERVIGMSSVEFIKITNMPTADALKQIGDLLLPLPFVDLTEERENKIQQGRLARIRLTHFFNPEFEPDRFATPLTLAELKTRMPQRPPMYFTAFQLSTWYYAVDVRAIRVTWKLKGPIVVVGEKS